MHPMTAQIHSTYEGIVLYHPHVRTYTTARTSTYRRTMQPWFDPLCLAALNTGSAAYLGACIRASLHAHLYALSASASDR
eukprot:366376-Chlamydomonas_euryale.AAC.2